MSARHAALALTGFGVALAAPLAGQTLERKLAASGGTVQFHYAARTGVCGNGRTFLRSEDGGYSINYGGVGNEQCTPGPVRVVVVREGSEILKIETFAGPLATDPESGRDLGAVGAREAADWFLAQAATLDGRGARDAMYPAMLADSAVVTPTLLALVKDPTRSRDIRRSAISWLSRRRAEAGGVGAVAVARTLEQLVRDRNESETLRSTALSTIGGMDRGEGIPSLITFAADGDGWLAKQAFASLARSGDPRARQHVRTAIRRSDLGEENRIAAIQGIGGDYAVASDLKMLRELYPSLSTDRERDALISALANAGGSENATWLLAIAQSPTEPSARRRRAVTLLSRYDDPRVKDALKGLAER